MDDKQLALLIGAINALTTEVRHAVEIMAARDDDDDQVLTFTIREYDGFDWPSIGAKALDYEDPERRFASVVAGADGKIYKRRSKDTYGSEIWFARANGKKADGTNLYKWLVKFIEEKSQVVEPLGRKAEAALKAAQSTPQSALQSPTPAAAKPAVNGAMKIADAIPAAAPHREPIPDALRAEWLAAFDTAEKAGTVPAEWHIFTEDTPATLAVKTNALRLMASASVDTPPEPTPAPEPETTTATEPSFDELLAAARVMLAEHAAQFLKAATGATKQQIADVKAVLIKHAGDEAGMRRALVALFDRDAPNGGQVLALFEWLRPARGTDGVYASNKSARAIVKQAALAQPVPEPA